MSTADAATAPLHKSLMPPHLQEDPGPVGLGTAADNSDSPLIEFSATVAELGDADFVVDTTDADVAPVDLTVTQSLPHRLQPRLDVPARQPLLHEPTTESDGLEQLERRRAERDLAGDNAVLLAKTQATAAWVQSETLWRQMKEMERDLVEERDQAQRVTSELASLRRELEAERQERTTAQAASDELRRYLDQQQGHLGFLRDRIVSMESERDIQQSCLGWMGRRRFRRLLQQRWEADPRTALLADGAQASVGNPLSVSDQQQFQ